MLRQDGSPPLYYTLLHFWLGIAGRSEESVHALSLLFATLAIPVAFWAGWTLFGRRTAWIAALLTAVNPFLTQYAQEGRMYALVCLLGMVSTTCWLQAFTTGGEGVRRAPAIGFAVAFAAMLYTHNWSIFFGAATGVAWLVLAWRAGRRGAPAAAAHGRARLRRRVRALRALDPDPALPGRPHGRAVVADAVARRSRVGARRGSSAGSPSSRVLLAAGAGVVALVRVRDARGRAVVALLLIALLTVVLAWTASQLSPAWAHRYFAVAVAPFLLLAAAGFAHAGRLGLVGLALVAVLWAADGAPEQKSNVREVVEAIAPSLRPGDLVVST